MEVAVVKSKLRLKGKSILGTKKAKPVAKRARETVARVQQRAASELSAAPAPSEGAAATTTVTAAIHDGALPISPSALTESSKPESAAARARSAAVGGGLVSASGGVLTGVGTSFEDQLHVGDGIEIIDAASGEAHVRVVTMVISASQAAISSAYPTTTAKAPSAYRILRVKSSLGGEAASKRAKAAEDDDTFAGEYSGGAGLQTWREKVGGSYRVRTGASAAGMTREQLLDMRAKLGRDKHC